MKVAQYEVLGRVFLKTDASRSGRSITNLRSQNRMRNRAPSVSIVPLPGRTCLLYHFPGTSYRATIKCPCRDGSSAHNVYPYANAERGTWNTERRAGEMTEAEFRIRNLELF